MKHILKNKRRAKRRKLLSLLPAVCLGLAGCGGGGGGSSPAETSAPPPPLGALLSALSRPGPVTIMPLGDSITYGYGDPAGNGYRLPLWQELTASGCSLKYAGSEASGSSPLPDTRNEGHDGYRIDMLAAGVDGWLKDTQPEIILLMIGTNDVRQSYQLPTAPDRLSALIDQILKDDPHVHLLVSSIPPIAEAGSKFDSDVQAFNARIPGIVLARAVQGKAVTYVDAGDAMTASDLEDAIHPTLQGYAKIAGAWFQALQHL